MELCDQICATCADKTPDARMPEGHVCGWWTDECDACGNKHGDSKRSAGARVTFDRYLSRPCSLIQHVYTFTKR